MSVGRFFLTGASGLIGQALLIRLVRAGWEGVVLLRRTPRLSPRERLLRLLAEWMEDDELRRTLPQVVALEGSVTEPWLGLDSATRTTLKALQPEVIHSAASLAFLPEQAQEVWSTNLQGTQNVCALVEALELPSWHLVSTAYGVGASAPTGPDAPPCLEQPFPETAAFHNAYEASKHATERWVLQRAAETQTRVTLFRPGCVIGDWDTGRTLTFRTLYGFIDLLDQEARGARRAGQDPAARALVYFSDIPRDATRNVVPSSYVADAMTWILAHPSLHGGIYHLTHPEPPSRWQSNGWMARAVGFGGLLMPSEVAGGGTAETVITETVTSETATTDTVTTDTVTTARGVTTSAGLATGSSADAPLRPHHFSPGRLARFSQVFRGYLEEHEPRFDTSRTRQALEGSGVRCPSIDEAYLQRVVRFCLETRWRTALEKSLSERISALRLPERVGHPAEEEAR